MLRTLQMDLNCSVKAKASLGIKGLELPPHYP